MKFLDQRAEVILRDLKKLMIIDTHEITYWQCTKGYYLRPSDVDNLEFEKTVYFTGKDQNYWFRTFVKIPERFIGKKVWLSVKTQAQGGGCQNPQFLLFVDNEIIQGMDTKHEQSLIIENATQKEIRIDLQAHTGYFITELKLESCLFILDEKIKKLYYDILVPILSYDWLEKESNERIKLSYHINECINLLDLRQPYSDNFYNSLDKAIEYIEKNIYTDMVGNNDIIASCIGHTHIDVAWRWTVEQTKCKVSRSFSTVCKLMQEYQNYKFMSSQPVLYKFLKQRYPEIYEKVKKLIKEKRWEPEGGSFVENDTNLPSGESLIRQFYFGKKFFNDEFGLNNIKILWLPDAFGYSGNLPQIMSKCNIKYFMTTKLAWNQYNKIPYDTFMWQGIDGTKILSYLITTTELKQNKNNYFTTYNGMLHPDAIMGGWHRYQNKDINNDILISYGYGDGGGGPTREMLEISKRMEKGIQGIPRVKQRFAIEFFEDLEKRVIDNKRLPEWVGELYFEYHRGTLSSMGRNKRSNRKTEFALMNLEFLALFSKLDYPHEKLEQIWETVLINQFHDILPGSSIKQVYDLTKVQYEMIEKELNQLLDKYLSNCMIESKDITIFNTLSFNRNSYVNLKNILGNKSGYLGNNIVQNGICYVKDIPSKGYQTFEFKPSMIGQSKVQFVDNILQTPFYTIQFDSNYSIKYLYDKKEKRQLAKSNLNQLIMYEDKPMWHDNWDIDEYYKEKSYIVDEVNNAYILEDGPIYTIFRIEKKISKSTIIQDMYIYSDTPRIDFKTTIDWKDSQHLLKAHFPLNLHSNEAVYDIQFGYVKRATHKNTSWDRARFESCAHKYVQIAENNYGVAILNDCKYGYSVEGTDIGITLVKSGIEPNEMADKEIHYITYSVYPHNNLTQCINESYDLNNEMIAYEGKMENDRFSFVNTDKENIVIETIKKAFDDDGIVIRLYESLNQLTSFKLNLNIDLKNAYLCDALENEIEKIDLDNFITIKPLEFLTIKVK